MAASSAGENPLCRDGGDVLSSLADKLPTSMHATFASRRSSGTSAAGEAVRNSATDQILLQVEPVSYDGYVFLDRVGETWVLTHTLTREMVVLEPGDWELHCESENDLFAVVGTDDEGNPKSFDLDDLFKKEVLRTTSGNIILRMRASGDEVKLVRLSEESLRYRPCKATFPVSCLGTTFELEPCVFVRPRHANSKVFWPYHSLYSLCQLKSYKGQPSKWVFNMLPKWAAAFEATFGHDQTVLGVQCSCGSLKKQGLPEEFRCLPQTSVSTMGLLWHLAKWIYASPQQGGLRSSVSRAACSHLLHSFLDPVFTDGALEFNIRIVSEWECLWPRPSEQADGRTCVSVSIAGGKIDLSPLVAAGERADRIGVAHSWTRALKKAFGVETDIEVGTVLGSCSNSPKLQPLLLQLLWRLAMALERALGMLAQGKASAQFAKRVEFEWLDKIMPRGGIQMEQRLAVYVYNCSLAMRGHHVMGIATDEGTVKAVPLQNTVLTRADNVAIFCCPQVDPMFDDEHLEFKEKEGAKRMLEGKENTIGLPMHKRHCNWLERKTSGKDSKSFRPLNLHRVSSKHWLCAVDNQLRISASVEGLAFFQFDRELKGLWAEWDSWPYLSVAMDLGPKGLCAYNSLERFWYLNCDAYPDNAHGCNRDFDMAISRSGLSGFWMVMMVVWNCEFGPDREHARKHQLSTAMASCYKRSSYESCPLFVMRSKELIEALENTGAAFADGSDLLKQAWAELQSRPFAAVGLSRCNLNRFMGTLHTASKRTLRWAIDRFERSFLALEADMMKGGKVAEKVGMKRSAIDTVEEGGATTSSSKIQFEDRHSMAFAQNAVVTSVVMLDNLDNKRVVSMVVSAASPVMAWHTTQSKELRSSDGTQEWLKKQVAGDLMKHIEDVFTSLAAPAKLAECEFVTSAMEVSRMEAGEIITEDDFAQLMAAFVVQLTSCRIRRTFHLTRGWHCRFFRLLNGTPEENTALLQEFKKDIEVWDRFRKTEGKQRIQLALEKRHAFEKVSIQQLIRGCYSENFQFTDRLKQVVVERSRLLVQTQVVEDAIGTQKNTNFTTAQKKFKKPEASMAAVLRQEVLSKRHGHTPVSCDLNFERKMTRLAGCAFKSDMADRSLDFGKIVGTSASPSWWSPGPSDHMAPHADVQAIRDAEDRGGFNNLEYCWASEMFDASHCLLFQIPEVHGANQWFYALGYFRNSAVAGWPCKLEKVVGKEAHFVVFQPAGVEPFVTTVFEVEKVRACSVRWRSWAWQYQSFDNKRARQQLATPAIRPFVEHGPAWLSKVAAQCAYWSLKVPFLTTLAGHQRISLVGCNGLCSVLFKMVQATLNIDDSACADVLSIRLAANDVSVTYSQQIMELDEAIDCMDEKDKKRVTDEQQDCATEIRERALFVSEYVSRRRAIDDARLATQRAARPKAKAKSAPTRPVFEGDIPQPFARQYLPGAGPSDASIWKDRRRGAWNGHVPPRARISEPYAGDEAKALRKILKRIWAQWLEVKGLDPSSCPYDLEE